MNNRKIKIYWVFKIVFKIIFSYLPISYTYWKKLGIFVHGEMDSPEYAENIFLEHFNFCVKSNSITVLEVGPGDSLFTCMIAKSFNVEKYYYVDKSKYVSFNPEEYKKMHDFLLYRSYDVESKLSYQKNLNSFLNNYNTDYLTDGIKSIQNIEDNSIDFIWSRAVLEHIDREEFPVYISEFKRILKPEGTMSHWIDFRDHFNGYLNNLRVNSRLWESELFKRGGFYTNRLNIDDIRQIFNNNKFSFEIVEPILFKKIPIKKNQITNDLIINNFEILKYESATVNSAQIIDE